MPVYLYEEKSTEGQAKPLALVEAQNPAQADKAFLAGRYTVRTVKTGEAIKLTKEGVAYIEETKPAPKTEPEQKPADSATGTAPEHTEDGTSHGDQIPA